MVFVAEPVARLVEALSKLPGIGPKTAKKIVAYRQQHPTRPFIDPDDLTKVKGIGKKTVRRIRPFIERSDADRMTNQ